MPTKVHIFSSGVNVYNIDLKQKLQKGQFVFSSLLWCFPHETSLHVTCEFVMDRHSAV